jgi:hypothetical protein
MPPDEHFSPSLAATDFPGSVPSRLPKVNAEMNYVACSADGSGTMLQEASPEPVNEPDDT